MATNTERDNLASSQMQRIEVKTNWWVVIFTGICVFGGALLASYLITWPALKAERLGNPLPGDWTWARIIVFNIFFFCLASILFWEPLAQLTTRFTSEGVERRYLWKQVFVKWSEVTEVFASFPLRRLYILELKTPNQKISINALFYRNREELLSMIRKYVPKHALLKQTGESND